jgi:hypothetical protein
MGSSAEGILAYGFDIGTGDTWGGSQYGATNFGLPEDETPDWWDNEDEAFEEAVERRLLAVLAGLTETWESNPDNYYRLEREAQERMGVKVVTYGAVEGQQTVIVGVAVQSADWGESKVAEFTVPDGADELLAAAVAALGVRPWRERPAWLLAASYG